jgi:hypothetical protein
MTIDTSIGLEDPRDKHQAGEDDALTDEERARKARQEGESVESDARRDLTREDIERGNDRNTSADQGNRSPSSNRLPDTGVEITGTNGGEPDAS